MATSPSFPFVPLLSTLQLFNTSTFISPFPSPPFSLSETARAFEYFRQVHAIEIGSHSFLCASLVRFVLWSEIFRNCVLIVYSIIYPQWRTKRLFCGLRRVLLRGFNPLCVTVKTFPKESRGEPFSFPALRIFFYIYSFKIITHD